MVFFRRPQNIFIIARLFHRQYGLYSLLLRGFYVAIMIKRPSEYFFQTAFAARRSDARIRHLFAEQDFQRGGRCRIQVSDLQLSGAGVGRIGAFMIQAVEIFIEWLGSVHNSSRGNILAQKCACRVENARKVSNLAALFALQTHFCAQNLTHG